MSDNREFASNEAPTQQLTSFEPLGHETLHQLITQGKLAAQELDKAIRPQFELSTFETGVRFR